MDILSVLSEQTTSVALAITIMWFYNKLVADVLAERKEMIEAVRAERKEWLETSTNYLDRLFELDRIVTEHLASTKAELHALKGKIQELIFAVRKEPPQ